MCKSDLSSRNGCPIEIAYIGGGSLNWAVNLMSDLAADGGIPANVRLYDIDGTAARRNARLGERFRAEYGVPVTFSVYDDLATVLAGAELVVISILPGDFDIMAADIDIPARYGVRQAVGDTVGPGGFIRALRAIPMLAEIGRAIGEHASTAYVCNLTNPMSALTGTLFAVFPGIRAWGQCHEVTKIRHIIAWLANRKAGKTVYDYRDVAVNVLGINHFTFVDRAVVGGEDLLPAYLAFAAENAESGWRATPIKENDEFAHYFEDVNKVKFDLARRFGIAAAAGDRHLAEFVPQAWYLDEHQRFGFALTPVEFRVRDRDRKRARATSLDAGAPLPPPARTEEALLDEIRALFGGTPLVTNANCPNQGQLVGLPTGAIIETNLVFSGLGVTPLVAGRLPTALELLVRPHAERQTALVDAVLGERWGDLFSLFLSDPLVVPLGPDKARLLYRDMVEATSRHLPKTLVEGPV